MTVKKQEQLARRVNRYLKMKSAFKPQYEKMDKLMAKILKDMKPNQQAGNGILVDNFAGTNKVYRAHGIERFELRAI